jgi:2-succinyl-5-enolpyruvyl-6-hydroxy-3-cyclohexene-1-carboxylate synthase
MVGEGLRIVEARTDRTANAALHARMREAGQNAVRASLRL